MAWALLTPVDAFVAGSLGAGYLFLVLAVSGAAFVGTLLPRRWFARPPGKIAFVTIVGAIIVLATTLLLPLFDESASILTYFLGRGVCVGLLAALSLLIARTPPHAVCGDGEAPGNSV